MAAAAAKPVQKIGVLGSKDVGRRLAAGFASKGYDVVLGTRDTKEQSLVKWQQETGKGVKLGSNEDCAKHGEIIFLATKYQATKAVIELAKIENFAGKIVIDATNPIEFDEKKRMVLATSNDNSAGEIHQKLLSQSKVVKAFNTINNIHFIDPKPVEGAKPSLIVCGDDANAKKVVKELAATIGFSAAEFADVGDITSSRYTEALCILWCRYAMLHNDWTSAGAILSNNRK